MTAEQIDFIKNIRDYFGLELSKVDENRIVIYLNDYENSLPKQKPTVLIKKETVYRDVPVVVKEDDSLQPYEIMSIISDVTKIKKPEICGKRRTDPIVLARHLFCYFVRTECKMFWTKIGLIINRDHTSIINSFKTVKEMIDSKNEKYVTAFLSVSKQIAELKHKKSEA